MEAQQRSFWEYTLNPSPFQGLGFRVYTSISIHNLGSCIPRAWLLHAPKPQNLNRLGALWFLGVPVNVTPTTPRCPSGGTEEG